MVQQHLVSSWLLLALQVKVVQVASFVLQCSTKYFAPRKLFYIHHVFQAIHIS